MNYLFLTVGKSATICPATYEISIYTLVTEARKDFAMSYFATAEMDTELYADFREEFHEHYQESEELIIQLENQPGDEELLRHFYRVLHTVKGNSGMMGLKPLVPLLQEYEDILSLVRMRQMPFTSRLGDFTLLLLDTVKRFIEECGVSDQVSYDGSLWMVLQSQIQRIKIPEQTDAALLRCIMLLDPAIMADGNLTFETMSGVQEEDADLVFLRSLARQAEERTHFWQGRVDRVINLAMTLNQLAGSPIASLQLKAAIYAHDVAMSFLPAEVLEKQGQLDDAETELMNNHVSLGCALLAASNRWREAEEMLRDHHERPGRKGYPNGSFPGDAAALLAVVHAFETITHGVASEDNKRRPTMRAIMEIGKHSGSQFAEFWCDLLIGHTQACAKDGRNVWFFKG